MRVLVYGFGPYKRFRENITAKVVKALPRRAALKRMIFPVRFHRGQFVEALKKHKPEIILGLGQSSRRRIQLETRAKNRRRASKEDQPRRISKNGPKWIATTLWVKATRQLGKSTNAGDYVCNFSMYVMLDHISRCNSPTAFGFIHIPHGYNLANARRLVTMILDRCYRPADKAAARGLQELLSG